MLNNSIPVCLPKLPAAEAIFPYLQQIDANRWYTNFGPLVNTFLSRIAELFNIPLAHVVCGANGTQLLEICLKALGVKAGQLCVMPSWTFVATPLAAVAANLNPVFVDVDRQTQTIDPKTLLAELPMLSRLGTIGAVMVTAPFGKPVDTLAWDEFTAQTDIPVIIDGAAAFDSVLQPSALCVSSTPIMVSLHATKVFGIGEGGLLLSTNSGLLKRIQNMTQFGFPSGVRNAHFLGTNGKMNEYAAAVGLAALDEWSKTRETWLQVANIYQRFLKNAGIEHMLSAHWASSTCNVIIPNQAEQVLTELEQQGIGARKWWGEGCHNQVAFKDAECVSSLSNTEWLQDSILGLPFYLDMSETIIEKVVNQVVAALSHAERTQFAEQ